MKIIFCNIRGLKRQKVKDKLRSLVNSNNPSLVWIVEPKIKTSNFHFKLPGMHHQIIHNFLDNSKGNIWLFWNCSITAPSVIKAASQCITVEVGEVLVTGVHVNSYTINRRELWQDLCDISLMNKPWLILGDLNIILSTDEKRGGRNPISTTMRDFQDCVDFCGLLQAPKSGLEFSWCNGRDGRKRILCNLDRALYNLKWLDKFNGWNYKVGTRGVSDHSPLLGSDAVISRAPNPLFRFQKMWLNHPYFLQVIWNTWKEEIYGNPIYIFMNKLKRLKIFLKVWNWEVFGDVKETLKKVEEKVLEETLKSDSDPTNINLLNNLVTARGKCDIAANNYNTFLRDKARISWIQDGDVNTKYFHTSIKLRQAQNSIYEIEDSYGNIITDQNGIFNVLIDYFSTKFAHQNVSINDSFFEAAPIVITTEDNSYLENVPTEEDIKTATFDLNQDGALGQMGSLVHFIDLLGGLLRMALLL
ncbi:uncharacterized protein LOC113295858 [Papaver somniferum]|uniref:uncharacterized protein LOC113295858 n=1 Tax=Papaver somniferum TaxID=3469 RepID=UPI000E7059BD|nr:uncharacterized protein LOC113295858 [Papaver somniferum]